MTLAPQFDSVDTEVLRQVSCARLGVPAYQQHLAARKRMQTVLIGYSESNRDSGICAARLAAYRAQHVLTVALNQAREGHVLFHSRGGSIPRGGTRIDELLRAAPAGSVSGVLRFTEQGESVAQSFGLRANAMRSLERAFNTLALATLAVRRGVAVQEGAAFAAGAAQIAGQSLIAWRALLERPGFHDFFRAVTPIDVIERMRIGAQRRREAPGASGVAAVPAPAWVYAWSQSRHMLPGWYGAGWDGYGKYPLARYPRLRAYVDRHYRPVAVSAGVVMYRRLR